MARPLHAIAAEIDRDWRTTKASPTSHYRDDARPYLIAMSGMTTINDKYGLDSGRDIVNRFLCNAAGWRGPTARRIKHELRELLK